MSAIASSLILPTSSTASSTVRADAGSTGFSAVLSQIQQQTSATATADTPSSGSGAASSSPPAANPKANPATTRPADSRTKQDRTSDSAATQARASDNTGPAADEVAVLVDANASAQPTPSGTDKTARQSDTDNQAQDDTGDKSTSPAVTDNGVLALLPWSLPIATTGTGVGTTSAGTVSAESGSKIETRLAATAVTATAVPTAPSQAGITASVPNQSSGAKAFATALSAATGDAATAGTAATETASTSPRPDSAGPNLQSLTPTQAQDTAPAASSRPASTDAILASLQQATASPTALQSAAPPAATAAASPGMVTVQLENPAFASQLGQNLATLVSQDVQQARIQVSPQGLGPIDIQLHVSNGVVDVNFAVQHPQTVHAIQQTLPQLDSLMTAQGLQLGQAQVGQQSAQSGGQTWNDPSQSESGAGTGTGDTATDAGASLAIRYSREARSMVDHFV